jgi:hypothetical protein
MLLTSRKPFSALLDNTAPLDARFLPSVSGEDSRSDVLRAKDGIHNYFLQQLWCVFVLSGTSS